MANVPLEHLNDLRHLTLEEVSHISAKVDNDILSYSEALITQRKKMIAYIESHDCCKKMASEDRTKEMLVPMTDTLFVSGQLGNVTTVKVNMGAGIYVEMALNRAARYYRRQFDRIKVQLEKMQRILRKKRKVQEVLTEMLHIKLTEKAMCEAKVVTSPNPSKT